MEKPERKATMRVARRLECPDLELEMTTNRTTTMMTTMTMTLEVQLLDPKLELPTQLDPLMSSLDSEERNA
jgi:hypothetical protein